MGAKLPNNPADIMATDLGNVLRRFERIAGAPFGLDGVVAAPYVAQLGEAKELEYLDDAHSAMDLSVRMTLVWSLVAVSTMCLLWRHGPWLSVPLISVILAFGSYRGSVAAAARYGNALVVSTALSKDKLYERFGVQLPESIERERTMNAALNTVLGGREASLNYRKRQDGQHSAAKTDA